MRIEAGSHRSNARSIAVLRIVVPRITGLSIIIAVAMFCGDKAHADEISDVLPDESVLPTATVKAATLTKPPQRSEVDRSQASETAPATVPGDVVKRFPGESVLATAATDGAMNTASQLPHALPSRLPSKLDEPVPAVEAVSEQSLPGENQLPVAVDLQLAATDADDPAAVPAAVADDSDVSPGETRPWLRLNYEGHTERVRAIAISSDGRWAISGGEDKALHVWQRTADFGWVHRRAIRWQIERGPRGRIYRVALKNHLAAIAGHGAMGGLGEIWIVDITTGELQRALVDQEQGHSQPIAQLRWAPGDQPLLASADVDGRVVAWRPDEATGIWSAEVIVDRDAITYGVDVAPRLQPLRAFVSFAFAGPGQLVVPRFRGGSPGPARVPLWQLEKISLDDNERTTLGSADHQGWVAALDASEDGGRIVVTDARGRTQLWTVSPSSPLRVVDLPRSVAEAGQPLALSLASDGRHLLLGLTHQNVGGVELWKLDQADGSPQLAGRIDTDGPVNACRLAGRDADQIWFSTGSQIRVHDIDASGNLVPAAVQTLATSVRGVRDVAFARQAPGYELAIDYGDGWQDTFDVSDIEIGREAAVDPERFRIAVDQPWTARPEKTEAGVRYRLHRGEQPLALLPLVPDTHGIPTAIAVIEPVVDVDQPDAGNHAIAVGTTSRGNIYVYQTPTERTDQPPRLIRQFRGHSGDVTALSVSADGRYLASGSADATVGFWPLADLWNSTAAENAWGIELTPVDQQLEVTAIRRDGPLFFRGVREGDRLVSIRFYDPSAEGGVRTLTDAEAVAAAIDEMPFDTLVVFQWERRGEPLAAFQSFPAWQPLAQLFIDRDREWAIWTPAGIYDASVNGHRRFGWQVNRGIDRLPDFFRADQFRQRLERPDVLRRLLERGSLSEALAAIGGGVAPVGDSAVVTQLRSRPRIEWISPSFDSAASAALAEIEAKIEIPLGATLAPPKLYAAGVAATEAVLVGVEQTDDGRAEHYRWTVPLVSRSEVDVEILAATQAGAWDRLTRTIRHDLDSLDLPARKPRLHLISVGVGAYRDPQIQSLDFAARGAAELHDLLADRAADLYRFEGVKLLDQDAVRPLWNVYSRAAVQRLAEDVAADDLVVIYLCGHGLRDRITGRWYFVTADARHSDLMNDRYGDCLAFSDLAVLSELPCRKLAILDSCHSGAVQPAMHTDDLKTALRWLQEDRILTLTASEGHQEAAEDRELRLGRFTARLIEALSGAADAAGDRDDVVTFQEVFAYVRQTLAEDSRRDGFIQRPTAGPVDLISTIHLPLTKAK